MRRGSSRAGGGRARRSVRREARHRPSGRTRACASRMRRSPGCRRCVPDGRPHVTPLLTVWLDERAVILHGTGRAQGEEPRAQPALRPHDRVQRASMQGLDLVVEGDAVKRAATTPSSAASPTSTSRSTVTTWHFDVRDGAFVHAEGNGVGTGVSRSRPDSHSASCKGTSSARRAEASTTPSAAGKRGYAARRGGNVQALHLQFGLRPG